MGGMGGMEGRDGREGGMVIFLHSGSHMRVYRQEIHYVGRSPALCSPQHWGV